MRVLPIINLLVLGTRRQKKPTTWFIDGQNLLGHKGTCRNIATLSDKLKSVTQAESVVLVLDAKRKEKKVEVEGIFTKVSLPKGLSADDFILQEITAMRSTSPSARIEIVTADRKLRKSLFRLKPVVRGVVNPVTFYRRYLPRLAGLKGRQRGDDDGDDDAGDDENETGEL